jgi:hypothetical protein
VFDGLRHRSSLAHRMGSDTPRAQVIAALLAAGDDPATLFTGGYGPEPLSEAERVAIAATSTALVLGSTIDARETTRPTGTPSSAQSTTKAMSGIVLLIKPVSDCWPQLHTKLQPLRGEAEGTRRMPFCPRFARGSRRLIAP